MLSNNQYAAIKHRKTDIFGVESAEQAQPRRAVDRNVSNLFQEDQYHERTPRTDRMASDIFFKQSVPAQYVPSQEEPKRRVQEEYAPVPEATRRVQEESYVPSQSIQQQHYEPEYSHADTVSANGRNSSVNQLYKSNIFETEVESSGYRGNRRHYGSTQSKSDIFHREAEDYRTEPAVHIPSVPAAGHQAQYRSSSFSNIFGGSDDHVQTSRASSGNQGSNRTSGLSSSDLSRETRGKGSTRGAPYSTSQLW